MNLLDAVRLLQQGQPIYRPSDMKKRYFFQLQNAVLAAPLYAVDRVDDKDEAHLKVARDLRFDVEDILAADWDVFKPAQPAPVPPPPAPAA